MYYQIVDFKNHANAFCAECESTLRNKCRLYDMLLRNIIIYGTSLDGNASILVPKGVSITQISNNLIFVFKIRQRKMII
jgi:hypothetical protein